MYDFPLDMNSLNSNSVIIKRVAPNSSVLEFGCANGRMTEYLHNTLNCKVTIVERDDSGYDAKKWSEQSFLGAEEGDIEKLYWCESLILQEKKFDYVIFADVLEHLHAPAIMLKYGSDLLKENGSVLISIPNVAHNSVIIDLMCDKFEYKDLGLLDKTHLRFFTEMSLRRMIFENKLKVVHETNLINAVGCTEFDNRYEDIPADVAKFLKQKDNAEVYQFVWELKKDD
jgi:O-antigen biosynthesis protein